MTEPVAPTIFGRFDGSKCRLRWQPVPGATHYRLYLSGTSTDDILEADHAVLGEADTEVLTTAAHGLTDGDVIMFSDLVGGTGLSNGVEYFVDAADANTFTVSLTNGGATVGFSTDVTAGTWSFVFPPQTLLAFALLADDPAPSWQVKQFLVGFAPVYIALAALNVGEEQSDLSNELRILNFGDAGRSNPPAAPGPPVTPAHARDPFG